MKNVLFVLLVISMPLVRISADDAIGSALDTSNMNAETVAGIIQGDAFVVFASELDRAKYDTDLKRRMFLKTDEGKPYADKLAALQTLIKDSGVTSILKKEQAYLSDYDVAKGGFSLNFNDRAMYAKPRIGEFHYDLLPAKKEYRHGDNFYDWISYSVFLPMNEEIAVNVEGNGNVSVKLVMKIGEVRGAAFYGFYPVASSFKIVLFDEKTGATYGEYVF